MSDYPKFEPIPRLHRDVVITEKIDGTNGLVSIEGPIEVTDGWDPMGFYENLITMGAKTINPADGQIYSVRAGSRNRWLSPTKENDNHGFAAWVYENAASLAADLGAGLHYGEWFGPGIGKRHYDLPEKRFALFNTHRWSEVQFEFTTPRLEVVPVIDTIPAATLNAHVERILGHMRQQGSQVTAGFMNPEGIVIYHTAAKQYFKVTLENDEKPKSLA